MHLPENGKSLLKPAILVLFFVKGMFWIFLFPVFQTPDEIRHFDYVAHVALKRHFPLGPNAKLPQNYYLDETVNLANRVEFRRLVYRPSQKVEHILTRGNLASLCTPESLNSTESMVHDFENIYLFAYEPIYYMVNAGVYFLSRSVGLNTLASFYLLRLLSLLLSLWAFWLFMKILEKLKVNSRLLLFATGFLFLWPQFSMFSISLQPDVMAMLLIVLASYFLINHNQKPPYILLGILIGLLGLVKFQYFATMLFSVSVLFTIKSLLDRKRIDIDLLKTIVIACSLSSLWMIHNFYYYHAVHPGDMLLNPDADSLGYRLGLFFMVVKGITLKSFLANFGWMDTQVPEAYYAVFVLFLLIAMISLFILIFRFLSQLFRSKTAVRFDDYQYAYLHLFFPLVVFVGLMLVVAILMSPLVNSQGRLYFPFVVPLTLFFVLVPYQILRKAGVVYLWGITLFLAVLHIHSVIIIWSRYYG